MDGDERRVAAVAVLAMAAIFILSVGSQQQNNQLVRPIPNAPAAPVVPDLPDLVGRLSAERDLCEGRAQYVIELFQQRRVGANIADGRRFYDEARSEVNGCIDDIRAGLSRRFVAGDSARIAAKLSAGETKVDRFVHWANSLEPSVGADIPVETISEMVVQWLRRVNEQNEQAIEQLRADLGSCRLREWRELGR